MNALSQFRNKKDIKAKDGAEGRAQFNDGSDGSDIVLKVPVGTVIQKIEMNETAEVLKIGERILCRERRSRRKRKFSFSLFNQH